MIKKIESGHYEYTDSNFVVWRVMNHGYTRGYACVMWVGISKNVSNSVGKNKNTSIIIWGYSRKDVIQRIEERVI